METSSEQWQNLLETDFTLWISCLSPKHKFQKFNDLFNLNQSYFVHSFIYDKLPPSFNNFFSKLPSFDRNLSLCTTLLRNNQLKLLPSYTLPLLWNSLPLSTKRISSASKFKRTYAEKLLSSYSSTCSKKKML